MRPPRIITPTPSRLSPSRITCLPSRTILLARSMVKKTGVEITKGICSTSTSGAGLGLRLHLGASSLCSVYFNCLDGWGLNQSLHSLYSIPINCPSRELIDLLVGWMYPAHHCDWCLFSVERGTCYPDSTQLNSPNTLANLLNY